MRLTEVMKYSTHSLSDDLSEKSELIPRFHPDFQLNYPEMLRYFCKFVREVWYEVGGHRKARRVQSLDDRRGAKSTSSRRCEYRDDLVIQLGGYVGLRAFEVPQIRSKDVKRSEDGEHYRLRVPEGKDTTGNGGKPRDAYLPQDVESDIHRYQNAEDIGRREPLVDLSERGVRDIVKRTANLAMEETGDEDFRYVSSHDLRRRFAQRLLVDRQMNPRVVIKVGGWDSFQAIEP